MKFAHADIAWEGGTAHRGDQVDDSAIPAVTRSTWEADGILQDSPPAAAEEPAEPEPDIEE